MTPEGNIVVTHESAMRCWLGMQLDGPLAPRPYRGNPLQGASDLNEATIAQLAENPLLRGHRLEVLVADRSARINTHLASSRLCTTPLPAGSFCQLAANLFIVSPELSLVQMACDTSIPRLAEFGSNLCANYRIEPLQEDIVKRRVAASSLRRMAFYVERARHVKGAANAKRALGWVLPGSESPMETRCRLLLCLPQRFGGYGLPLPECNLSIEAGKSRSMVGQGVYRLDMCWPEAKVVVEYDGRKAHLNAHTDKRRRNDLEALGWTYYSITSSELFEVLRFDKLAQQVASSLGHRLRKRDGWLDLHLGLRAELGVSLPDASP